MIENSARRGGVDGEPVGEPEFTRFASSVADAAALAARVPDPAQPAKLEAAFVLPGIGVPLIFVPYWVVYVSDDYSRAIVTGGPPRVATAAGRCAISAPGFAPEGRWELYLEFRLLSRAPVDPAGEALLRAEAAALGLDLAQLVKMEQEGCEYPAE